MLSCLQRLLSGRLWALISLHRQRLRSMTSSNFPSLWVCVVDGMPPPLTAGCPWASWASCWNCNCRWCCCWSCWSCCFNWSCCWWSWSCCCCRETLGLLGLQGCWGCGRPCSWTQVEKSGYGYDAVSHNVNLCHIPITHIPIIVQKNSNYKSYINKSAVFTSSHQEAALLHPLHVAEGWNSRMETVSAALNCVSTCYAARIWAKMCS